MKKYSLLLLITIVSTISLAQTKRAVSTSSATVSKTAAQPSFGVRAGVISSGISGEASGNFEDLLSFADGMITTSNRTGFFAGGYATIPFANSISLEPGVFYSQKGYDLNGELAVKGIGFLGANAKAKLQSEYIDIPVLLKLNAGGLQVFAGPQFSYLMKANLNTTAGLLGIDLLNRDMDVTENFNRWDAAITGGVGYTFGKGINIRASYDHGLSKIDKNQNTKAYNNAIKVGIGIEL